jgi:hypothetical protein
MELLYLTFSNKRGELGLSKLSRPFNLSDFPGFAEKGLIGSDFYYMELPALTNLTSGLRLLMLTSQESSDKLPELRLSFNISTSTIDS